ncbi:MAG: HDOD domain-containing protein [Saccharospirillaceae bacterium]|nr:HDOD domain-containing protein [Pseudomonadales bacterium]NRB78268.1 HDOD domain-containing protein [Saccharospirillaceae bacterium]
MPFTTTAEEKVILEGIQLPICPKTLINILTEAKKTDPNMYLISQWISKDIGIASAVLQIINSPVYARSVSIDSITQAVMLLGFNRVLTLVKVVALKTALPAKIDLTSFWQLSTEIAQAALNICHFLEKPKYGETAYMLGLFHMAGIPVLLDRFTDYAQIYQNHKKSGLLDLSLREQTLFGTTHTTLSSLIAQQWGISDPQCTTIYYTYHCEGIFDNSELNEESLVLLSVIKIARKCIFMRHNIEHATEWSLVKDCIETFLHMDESDINELIDQAEQQFE